MAGAGAAVVVVPEYDGAPSDHDVGPPLVGAGAGAADEPENPVYVDESGAGAGAGRDGAAELGLLVTSGLDGEGAAVVELSPGDDGRLAPPFATARAAAVSAADPEEPVDPEEPPDDIGRVDSFVPDDAVAAFEPVEPVEPAGVLVDEPPEGAGVLGVDGLDDDFELTLGEASVVIGAAPPPELGRDVVPGR